MHSVTQFMRPPFQGHSGLYSGVWKLMDDDELLRRELRSTREERTHKCAQQSEGLADSGGRLPLMPERNEALLPLALMGVEGLETHIDRRERGLTDLEDSIE